MIEKLIERIASAYHSIFGSTTLFPYEQMCLDAWRATLSDKCAKVLDAQLDAVRLVQHQAGGAKVCLYFRGDEGIPLFCANQPNVHAATIILGNGGNQTLKVKIFVHLGRLFSIEFPKRPERYMQQHRMHFENLHVINVETITDLD